MPYDHFSREAHLSLFKRMAEELCELMSNVKFFEYRLRQHRINKIYCSQSREVEHVHPIRGGPDSTLDLELQESR